MFNYVCYRKNYNSHFAKWNSAAVLIDFFIDSLAHYFYIHTFWPVVRTTSHDFLVTVISRRGMWRTSPTSASTYPSPSGKECEENYDFRMMALLCDKNWKSFVKEEIRIWYLWPTVKECLTFNPNWTGWGQSWPRRLWPQIAGKLIK